MLRGYVAEIRSDGAQKVIVGSAVFTVGSLIPHSDDEIFWLMGISRAKDVKVGDPVELTYTGGLWMGQKVPTSS